jgi:hypothetical protein
VMVDSWASASVGSRSIVQSRIDRLTALEFMRTSLVRENAMKVCSIEKTERREKLCGF